MAPPQKRYFSFAPNPRDECSSNNAHSSFAGFVVAGAGAGAAAGAGAGAAGAGAALGARRQWSLCRGQAARWQAVEQ